MSEIPKQVKVLQVDDDDLVAQIVRIMLKHADGFEWAGQLRNADTLVEQAASLQPDIVLLDLCMPGTSPLEAISELKKHVPATRVVVFSGRRAANLIDRAFEAGAWGYVAKDDSDGQTLLDAIRRVAAGEIVIGAACASPS